METRKSLVFKFLIEFESIHLFFFKYNTCELFIVREEYYDNVREVLDERSGNGLRHLRRLAGTRRKTASWSRQKMASPRRTSMSALPPTRSNQAGQVIKFLQRLMLANHLHHSLRITKPDGYLKALSQHPQKPRRTSPKKAVTQCWEFHRKSTENVLLHAWVRMWLEWKKHDSRLRSFALGRASIWKRIAQTEEE